MSEALNGRTAQLIEKAISIRLARAVDDHVNSLESRRRLALEQAQVDMEGLRELIVTAQEEARAAQQRAVEAAEQSVQTQQRLIEELSDLLGYFKNVLPRPVEVNVPESRITLDQQPVNVNVPAPIVNVSPNVNVPELIIPERPVYTKARVKHSDGTQSTIEFLE